MRADDPDLPERQADQRQLWRKTQAAHSKNKRTRRAQRRAAVITGIRHIDVAPANPPGPPPNTITQQGR